MKNCRFNRVTTLKPAFPQNQPRYHRHLFPWHWAYHRQTSIAWYHAGGETFGRESFYPSQRLGLETQPRLEHNANAYDLVSTPSRPRILSQIHLVLSRECSITRLRNLRIGIHDASVSYSLAHGTKFFEGHRSLSQDNKGKTAFHIT